MKISNMSNMQLTVAIVGVNNDVDTVLLQPKGSVELPEGFSAVNPKLRDLYIHPSAVAAKGVKK